MFERVLEEGTYSNPAWKRYGKKVVVRCDHCQKSGLEVCIGLDDIDLCMNCVEILTKKKSKPAPIIHDEPVSFMLPSIYNDRPMTRMEASIYEEPFMYATMMEFEFYNSIDEETCRDIKNLYLDKSFDREVSTVIKKIGSKRWKDFMDLVIKQNRFQQLDVDTIYAIKRLFAKIYPKYAKNCEMRIKYNQNAVVYRVNDSRTGFTLSIENRVIGDVIYNKETGLFSKAETRKMFVEEVN